MARVVVVGAGMAGLVAARELVGARHDVVVLDKGYTPGGRMATRHLDGATFDHGAQFLTAKSDWFTGLVDGWRERELATTWFHGGPDRSAGNDNGDDEGDGHPRFRGRVGMRSICEAMAADLDVRTSTRVVAVAPTDAAWTIALEVGDDLLADAVLLTAPAEQALALLDAGGTPPTGELEGLHDVVYDPCWAALVVPDGTPDLPDHGALRLDDHPLHFVTDNRRKGISSAPAVTLHASPDRTRELFERDGDEVGRALLADAADLLTGTVVRTHRWRYSNPETNELPSSLLTTDHAPLAVAGDAYAGGRVEGAATSGRDAAQRLIDTLG